MRSQVQKLVEALVRRERHGAAAQAQLPRRWRRAVRPSVRTATAAGLTALLVGGVGVTAAHAGTLPAGPSTTGVTGERPNATRIPFSISDRIRASVDVGTGNLNLQVNLLNLPGISGTAPIGLVVRFVSPSGVRPSRCR